MPDFSTPDLLTTFTDTEYVSFGGLLFVLVLLKAIQVIRFKILFHNKMLKLKIARFFKVKKVRESRERSSAINLIDFD